VNCHLNCGKVLTSKTSKLLGGPSSKQKPKNLKPQNSCIVVAKLQNFWISVAPAANQKLKTSKQLDYCDRSSKSKPQNFKTHG